MSQVDIALKSASSQYQNILKVTGDGVEIPKLTTADRLALSLGPSDSGIMCFDTTIGQIFVWSGTVWESAVSGASSNTQVIFNDNGDLNGDPKFTFDKVAGLLTTGVDSTAAIPERRQRIFGNVHVDAGTSNPNGVEFRVIGPIIPYHAHHIINGLNGGFAGGSDHSHSQWLNFAPGVTQPQTLAQTIYTAIPTQQTSYVAHGAQITALGTEFGNENSIDTTGTAQFPVAPAYTGTVKLRFNTDPGIAIGESLLLQIIAVQVAGIQAAVFSATSITASTLVGVLWEVQINVDGLDPIHWNWNNRNNTPLQNANWQLNRLVTPLANTTQIASVPSDSTAVNVTFTAVPASVAVGKGCSILLKGGTTLTGLIVGLLYPGYVSAVNGLVVTIRLRNSRIRNWETIGGSDATPARFSVIMGIRDVAHEPTPSHCAWIQYRNGEGTVTATVFGSSDVGPTVDRSIVVGRNLICINSDEWVAGTDNISNRMALSGNVLKVNGLNVGTGTNIGQIKHGRATLVGGTVTVLDASVTTNSRIFASSAVGGGTPGWLRVSARSAGVSFTILSSSGTDTSQVDWMIINP